MKVQGTELYVIDPGDSDGNPVLDVGCLTELNPGDGSVDENETTCLADLAKTFEPGLEDPGEGAFAMQFDPANPVHVRLHQLKKQGVVLKWAIGWSDGTGIQPTADSAGEFVLPNTRSWLTFDGYMKSFPFQFARGQQVNAPVALRLSGEQVLTPKSA
jgi:hypothetical protein